MVPILQNLHSLVDTRSPFLNDSCRLARMPTLAIQPVCPAGHRHL